MNGEPLPVDTWARSRQTDLQIFTQETHHARRLDPGSYDKRDAETWDTMFSAWLIAKGRVRAPQPRFMWATPELPEEAELSPTMEGGVLVRLPYKGASPEFTEFVENIFDGSEVLKVSENPQDSANVETSEKDEHPIRAPKKAKAAR